MVKFLYTISSILMSEGGLKDRVGVWNCERPEESTENGYFQIGRELWDLEELGIEREFFKEPQW